MLPRLEHTGVWARPCAHLVSDEEVLRLDVSVDDVLGMAVGEGLRQLQDVLRRQLLAEAPLGRQRLVQLPPRRVPATYVHTPSDKADGSRMGASAW